MRLIDADTLKETIECHAVSVSCCSTADWARGKAQMKKQVMDDIDNAPTVGGWISVKDRLPEDGIEVIVRFECEIGDYICTAWHDKGRWTDGGIEWPDENATHWMMIPPLPEPPKEAEG